MAQYVLLDTNILVRFVTQGVSGCEPEHWNSLKQLAQDRKVRLFNSKVVELEFAGQCYNLEDKLRKAAIEKKNAVFTEFQNSVGRHFARKKDQDGADCDKNQWNEINDMKKWFEAEMALLQTRTESWIEEKIVGVRKRIEDVKALLQSPIVERLEFDEDIMRRTKQRFFAKRFKQYEDSSKPEADYNIVDSVVRYFETGEKGPVLLCTGNTRDFAWEPEGKPILHHFITEDFPKGSGLILSLSKLVEFITAGKPVEETPPEKIQEAIEHESQTNSFEDSWKRAVRLLSRSISGLDRLRNNPMKSRSIPYRQLSTVISHGRFAVTATRYKHIESAARKELRSCSYYATMLLRELPPHYGRVLSYLESVKDACSELLDMISWMEEPIEEYADEPDEVYFNEPDDFDE